MNALLSEILDGHGGQELWHNYECIDANILAGGGLLALKGQAPGAAERRCNNHRVNFAAGFAVSVLTCDYLETGGIRLPAR